MLRFAPSPTADMDLNDLYVALINYLVSQQLDEPFIIRIEDNDKTNFIEGKDTEIMQILEKFALIHTSVLHQSEHLHMHQTLAIKLLEANKAFLCTCPTESALDTNCLGTCQSLQSVAYQKLRATNTPFVIRMKAPTKSVHIHDRIQGEITTSIHEMGTSIILQKDNTPSALFASACDDMISGVKTIIRTKKYLIHTPIQKYMQMLLGYTVEMHYAHLPPITDAPSIIWLFQEGFIPDAILNYLLLLGNENTPKEICTLPEAIPWFSLDNISKEPLRFDKEKLRNINREHLKKMDNKQLSTLFGFADAALGQFIKLHLEEAATINELALRIRPLFAPKDYKNRWKEEMKTIQKIIIDAPMIHDFSTFTSFITQQSGLKDTQLNIPLRLLLTGMTEGPELSDIYPLIKPYLLEIVS